jgi:hypothetical protein
MATKAERFRAASQKTGAASRKPKSKKSPRGGNRLKATADTSKPGTSADDRRWGGSSTAARNLSKHAARKASYALEDSQGDARPSRKSTRGSSNHQKADSALKTKVVVGVHSPQARATRGR